MELCVSPSHSIPANSGIMYSYNVTPISGYKAIGVVGFQNTGSATTLVVSALVSINEAKIYTLTRNMTNSAQSVQDYIRVLYIRDGFTV